MLPGGQDGVRSSPTLRHEVANALLSPRGVMPPSVVAALVAAGLGEKSLRGTLDINDAGRDYLSVRNLPTNT